ncbi:hypothetical protein E4U19_004964 [Claviceps sp. Clav32 group G5]|nr:hypothetical protein E4U19_004964 [Claviceps sp. Clav32 group G5]KAG6044541.1 hypothetical protein E4U39_003236 [Claviceps sp. Clav50 group G5]
MLSDSPSDIQRIPTHARWLTRSSRQASWAVIRLVADEMRKEVVRVSSVQDVRLRRNGFRTAVGNVPHSIRLSPTEFIENASEFIDDEVVCADRPNTGRLPGSYDWYGSCEHS